MEDRRFGNGRHSISKTARRNGEVPARSPKPADLGATVASERTVPPMVMILKLCYVSADAERVNIQK
jgi:hypothetical protein